MPSSAQFLQHVDTTRAHINLTTTRAQETAQPKNTALPGTATPADSDNANGPQTFDASRHTQGQRRWHVIRTAKQDAQVLDLDLTKPWGVHVDSVDGIPGDLVWVGNFETFEQAVTFADWAARS